MLKLLAHSVTFGVRQREELFPSSRP